MASISRFGSCQRCRRRCLGNPDQETPASPVGAVSTVTEYLEATFEGGARGPRLYDFRSSSSHTVSLTSLTGSTTFVVRISFVVPRLSLANVHGFHGGSKPPSPCPRLSVLFTFHIMLRLCVLTTGDRLSFQFALPSTRLDCGSDRRRRCRSKTYPNPQYRLSRFMFCTS